MHSLDQTIATTPSASEGGVMPAWECLVATIGSCSQKMPATREPGGQRAIEALDDLADSPPLGDHVCGEETKIRTRSVALRAVANACPDFSR